MYEIIEIYIIALIAFIFAFVAYTVIALKYYERKIKKIKKMAPDVLEMIYDSVKEVIKTQHDFNERLGKLEVAVGKITVKIGWKRTLIGALSSAIVVAIAIILKGL